MTDGSNSDRDANPIEEVKVYCDEGVEEKNYSDNFTLEGIGLLNEATRNASQEMGLNTLPFLNGANGIFPWNLGVLPMMFNPYMCAPQLNTQWLQQGFPIPPCFPYYQQFAPPANDIKPPRPDGLYPPNFNGAFNQTKEPDMPDQPKRPYVKKPLNAFMIFMREKRNEIMVECTMRESASVNQILGKKWHELDRAEQNKYYELARNEKERHRQLHPDWSARDNYASRVKKRRYKSLCVQSDDQDCSQSKKCRALLGINQRDMWCKHCRGKKKCMRPLYGQEGDYRMDDQSVYDGDYKVDSESVCEGDYNADGESVCNGQGDYNADAESVCNGQRDYNADADSACNGQGDHSSSSTEKEYCLDSVKVEEEDACISEVEKTVL